MSAVVVRWVGDFAVILCTAETVETDPVEFTRAQLIDWHGIDPLAHGFRPEIADSADHCVAVEQ